MSKERGVVNTDREIWRERPGDFYSDSIHVTEGGGIGINCGGHVIVLPVRELHRRASALSQEAVRDTCSHEWTDATNQVVSGTEICLKCFELRGMTANALKREPNAAGRSDLVQVTRAFLESLQCPNPNCAGGWITNTGPEPQHDSCPWCEARDRFLAGDIPLAHGASDD